MREQQPLPDQIGPFEVVRRLGAGGMAETFEARRQGPAGFVQRVCIKRILPSQAGSAELQQLFLREARLAATLSHRNIVRVVELGDDRGPYLALELIDGVDLRSLCATGPIPVEVAALVGLEIAEALDHAHTRSSGGILHRDVTPANILVSTDGDVKLSDFGIARAIGEAPLTSASLVRGNIWYMAPEQLEGTGRVGPLSDLFSLGVVLYQCIAGRRPYEGRGLTAMRALYDGQRTALARAAPGTPEAMCTIVDRLLSEDPSERLPSAADLAEALSRLAPRGARRELQRLVQARRATKKRAAIAVEAPARVTMDLPIEPPVYELPTLPARPSGAPHVRATIPGRWQKYARGPRAWSAPDIEVLARARSTASARGASTAAALALATLFFLVL